MDISSFQSIWAVDMNCMNVKRKTNLKKKTHKENPAQLAWSGMDFHTKFFLSLCKADLKFRVGFFLVK